MDPGWIKIFSSNHLWQVEIKKSILNDEGISSVIVNKKDSAYLFGEYELYVSVEDAFMAKQYISKTESE
ncbi:MAG: DUF2007 domain-containing protein [Bacteroidetes bacterium]|nr:DUF2007 domain-containing protein [Bacteroidota bacterium]